MKKTICCTLILCLGLTLFASCSEQKTEKKHKDDTKKETVVEDEKPEKTTEETTEATTSEETTESSIVEGLITEEEALYAVKSYCYLNNPDLEEIVNEGVYPVYWDIDSIDDSQIVVVYRSYTGALIRYYIDRVSGSTYVTNFVAGITEEEERTDESLNIKDYLI
ncbi:MAG: hypothetical protein MJ172_11470 [Clostridia bacterium]|nr:hypothetical protein [Clostridia bacterium]